MGQQIVPNLFLNFYGCANFKEIIPIFPWQSFRNTNQDGLNVMDLALKHQMDSAFTEMILNKVDKEA